MRKFGIEHTLLPKYHDIGWFDVNKKDEYQTYLIKKIQLLCKLTDMPYLYPTDKKEFIYADPGVIEWISPILSSYEEAEIWFHKVQEYADAIDFTSFREDVCLGGGHIHLSVPKEEDRLKIANHAKLYPYLFWSTLSSEDEYNGKVKVELFSSKQGSFCCRVNAIEPRWDYKTVEWRAFDSAATWEIQYLQIRLAQKMIEKLSNESYLNRSQLLKKIQNVHVIHRSLDQCVISFRNLIEELGLKKKDYNWLIERNLKPRFQNEEFLNSRY